MLIKYSCPLCQGTHILETGGSEANQIIEKLIASGHERFANSVIKTHNARAYKSAKGARSRGPVLFGIRDVKKAVKSLKEEHGIALNKIDGLECASTKMLAVVHIGHTDGKTSKLVAESGNTEILGSGAGDFEGHKIAVEYVGSNLHSLFTSKELVRATHFSNMSEEDFSQNCAAIKALLAIASDRKTVRDGSGALKYLSSSAALSSISLTESIYKPFTEKMPKGFRQFSRIVETTYDDPVNAGEIAESLVVEPEVELEAGDHYLAKPCTRCQFKVPAIICPVEIKATGAKFAESASFMSDT